MRSLKNITHFRAFHHKNYRIYMTGHGISLVGTWMQSAAMSWLVYRLTQSSFMLGLVGFVGNISTFLLASFAGVIADRYDRKRTIIITQSLALLQALLLSFLVLKGTIEIWHILLLSSFLGFIYSFDIPVRQTFTADLIGRREDLSNAIALNSSIVNLARFAGPSLAGIIIAAFGEGPCFLINAISFIFPLTSLKVLQLTQKKSHIPTNNVLYDLKKGFHYTFSHISIRSILLLFSLLGLVGMPYQVLMPVIARELMHGGPKTLGFLMAMSGLGAFIGALYLAGKVSLKGLDNLVLISGILLGIGLISLGHSSILIFSLLSCTLTGFSMVVHMASCNTLLQTISDEPMRGRVMSFFTMAFMGTMPIGSLIAGTLAKHMGVTTTLTIGGILCILGSLIFSRSLPHLKSKIQIILAQNIETMTEMRVEIKH
ncbi:MAG: MFS transporter [Deltaproteobacteria bacterium]|nr:MFS transporter [Deltaproteobacteria bacterium]